MSLLSLILFLLPSFNFLGWEKEYGKSIFFLFAIALFSILWPFLYLRPFPKKFFISKVDICIAAWTLYISGNIFFTHSPLAVRTFELGGLLLLYMHLRSIDVSWYGIILFAIIAASAVQAVYGNMQLWGMLPSNHAYFKMTGSFLNPGPYAGYLISAFPVIVGMIVFHKSLIPKANIVITRNILLIIGALILLAWSAADSRASYIALGLSVGLILWKRYSCYNRFQALSLKIRSFFITSTLLLFIMGCVGLFKMKENSAMGRLLVWNVSTEIVAGNLWMGIGFDNFKSCYMNKQADFFKINPNAPESMVASDTCYAFNEYLQAFVETGLVGFILMLGILVCALNSQNKYEKDNMLMAKAGILSIAAFALFSYPAQILPIKVTLVCYLAWIANMDKKIFTIDLSRKKYAPALSFLLLVGVGICGLCKLPSYYQAYKKWSLSHLSYNRGDYAQCIDECKLAYPWLKEDGNFLTYYGKALTLNRQHDSAVGILNQATLHYPNVIVYIALGDNYTALSQFKEAEQAYLQAWYMIPSKFYLLYKLAKLYDKTGQGEQAVSVAEGLLNKKVKVESRAIDEMKDEMLNLIEKYKSGSTLTDCLLIK